MKKFALVLLSATILAAPMAQARDDHRGHNDRGRHIEQPAPHKRMAPPKRVVAPKHHWKKGHRMTAAERRHMREVRDYRRHRLSAPPRGHRWVQIDNEFLLVGITSGIIASIIAGR